MAKSSPERQARREHVVEAFIVQKCPGCGRFFVLRGRVAPVSEGASEDEAASRAYRLAAEYEKRKPSRHALIVVTEGLPGSEPLDADDDASLH